MVYGAEPPHCSETAVLSERTSASAETVAAIGAGLCTVTLPLTAQALSTGEALAVTVQVYEAPGASESLYVDGSESAPPIESVTCTAVNVVLPVFVTVIVQVMVSLRKTSGVQLLVTRMCGSSTRKLSVLLFDSGK